MKTLTVLPTAEAARAEFVALAEARTTLAAQIFTGGYVRLVVEKTDEDLTHLAAAVLGLELDGGLIRPRGEFWPELAQALA